MAAPGLSGTPWGNLITTSLRGRRLGLQRLSTVESGGSRGEQEYLVGPAAFRMDATTSESTGTNLHPFGVSLITSGTSAVYTIDPPIPGVAKFIAGSTSGPFYVKTANNETIITTEGSSFTTIKGSSHGGSFQLWGVTTAIWGMVTAMTTAGFALTTST